MDSACALSCSARASSSFCWIGASSVLLDGATLKVGCVIGAHSLVLGATDAYGVYSGNPLVKRGERIEK